MVDATLAELVGGEMLFPGRQTVDQDREPRIAHMRKLFDEAVAAMRRNDYAEAETCLKALRLVYDISVSVYRAKTAQGEEEG